MFISKNDVDVLEPDHLITEASSIGIRAGVKWPQFFQTNMGNQNNFNYYSHETDGEDELISVTYKQENGNLFLEVLND